MLLDEHGSKEIFSEYGLAVPAGLLLRPEDVAGARPDFPLPWYLKSQVLAGGRGKAGAIQRIDRWEDLPATAAKLFALAVKGRRPPYLRLEPAADIVAECYVSLTVSRDRQRLVLTVSPAGGMEVEANLAAPPLIQSIELPQGPADHQVRAAFFRLGLAKEHWPAFRQCVDRLYAAVRGHGLLLAEINPLALTREGTFLALDGKVEIDGNYADLKPELGRFYVADHYSEEESQARERGFSYVRLGGWVGTIANGAGLAMATMDLLNFSGLPAANFLDLGGTADQERIRAAFRLLFDDAQVRAVFVNLYGGILSCERVALAMREALGDAPPPKPLVVRLAGNGAVAGRSVLERNPLAGVYLAGDMNDALELLAPHGPRNPAPPQATISLTNPVSLAVTRATPPLRAMAMDLGSQTRVLVQGITGKVARFHSNLMRAYGTQVVAGVTPFKGGELCDGVPVYSSIAEARRDHEIDASIIFVPAAMAADAILEAAGAGIPWVVCITEGIPQQDMLAVLPRLGATRLIGPNTPGVIVPDALKMGIMPVDPFTPGPVAIFSRSGTLTYEAASRLTAAGYGQSYALGVGGDPFVGLSFADCLEMTRHDERVRAVLVLGEIGGRAEEDLAAHVTTTGFPKPVVAFIAGRTAPPGRRLGHAGAILEESGGGVTGKLEAMAAAGFQVCTDLASIPGAVRRVLGTPGGK